MNSIHSLVLTSLLETWELEKQIKAHYMEVIDQIQNHNRQIIHPGAHSIARYLFLIPFNSCIVSYYKNLFIYSWPVFPSSQINFIRTGILVYFCSGA